MAWFAKRPRGAAQGQTVRTLAVPLPALGLNTTDDPHTMDPRFARVLKAIVSDSSGLRTRTGTRYHIDSASGLKSMIAFHGATNSDDRLFTTSATGIYDVSSAAASLPAASVTFGLPGATNAGWCSSATLVTGAGPFLLVCDEGNGYHYYNPSGAAWTQAVAGAGAGQINGADPAQFSFVTIWKNRVWFIQGGTGRAWYLPVGQYAGTVQSFDFGNKFSSGGYLAGLYSWTHDGGAGIDDHLVAVSSAGDVLVYSGTDPATAGAFNLVGSWSTGGLGPRRRFAVDVGGDLWLWLKSGILPISALKGGALQNPRAFVSYPVAAELATVANPAALHYVVEDRAFYAGGLSTGYLVSANSRAWCVKGGNAPLSMATYRGVTYMATASAIWYATGAADNVARDGTGGDAIECEWATPYMGGDGRWKNWTQFRARFSAAPTPGASSFVSTDPAGTASFTPSALDGSWFGLSQGARNGSLDLVFSTSQATTLHGLDVQFIPGGAQ